MPVPHRVTDSRGVAPDRAAALTVQSALASAYPDARCELDFATTFELLVATVLSAQTTDVRVNAVTPTLFARWPDATALAGADISDLEGVLRPLGMARSKAGYLSAIGRQLVREHDGEVPLALGALEALAGVGRKTAHVVLGDGFGVPKLTVDTHVARVATRLGWATAGTPRGIENEVVALLPDVDHTLLSHRLIFHGRRCCLARSPRCDRCPVRSMCPSAATDRESAR